MKVFAKSYLRMYCIQRAVDAIYTLLVFLHLKQRTYL